MQKIEGKATSELTRLKDGTVKVVFEFKNLLAASRVEPGKIYELSEVEAENASGMRLSPTEMHNLGIQQIQDGMAKVEMAYVDMAQSTAPIIEIIEPPQPGLLPEEPNGE